MADTKRFKVTFERPNGSRSSFPGIIARNISEAKNKFKAMSAYRDCKIIAVVEE